MEIHTSRHLLDPEVEEEEQGLYVAERLPYSIDPAKIRLLNDNVLVKLGDSSERKYGLIIIPDKWKERSKNGTVVAVASREEPYEFAIGDRVYVEAFAGVEFLGFIIIKDTYVVAYEH